jgi:hypothetical protein
MVPFVLRRSARPPLRPAQSRRQSARGLAQSKTLRAVFGVIVNRASVLECGGPPPLSSGVSNSAQVSGICYLPAILLQREKVNGAEIFVLFAPVCGYS